MSPKKPHGKPQAAETVSGPTVTITPDSFPVGTLTVAVTGSGYTPGQGLVINFSMGPQPWLDADADGAFSIDFSPTSGFWAAGKAAVEVLEVGTLNVLATAPYEVV